MEKTLAIIKPDAVERNLIGKILERIEANDFKIVAIKMVSLSAKESEGFYHVHKDRTFFKDLTQYMSSGPVVLLVISKADAIASPVLSPNKRNPPPGENITGLILFTYKVSL